jgi:phosphoribosylaminoimidazole-succinocarboxamide synthase
MRYRDDLTALNGGKKGSFPGKGALNRRISDMIFAFLETGGVKTHFIKTINEYEVLIRKVHILPLEVIVRNIAAGSFSKKYGVPEGKPLKMALLEFSLKDDALGDPMISPSHAIALELVTEEQLNQISGVAMGINNLLKALFDRVNLTLVDFKIEFGTGSGGNILLADEITPDTCRLWEKDAGVKMDKDRFRQDLGGVEEAYREVANRLANY